MPLQFLSFVLILAVVCLVCAYITNKAMAAQPRWRRIMILSLSYFTLILSSVLGLAVIVVVL